MSLQRSHKNLGKIFMFLREHKADMDTYNAYLELEEYFKNLDKIGERITNKIEKQEFELNRLLKILDEDQSKRY